jgi:hypothetical protein
VVERGVDGWRGAVGDGEGMRTDNLEHSDETAIGLLPAATGNDPVGHDSGDELGVEFTEDTPEFGRAPFVDLEGHLPLTKERFDSTIV